MILARGNLTYDTTSGVLRAEKSRRMPPKLGHLLEALLRTPRVLPRDVLLDWLANGSPDSYEGKLLDVHVCRLRTMLREVGASVRVVNAWGRGFEVESADRTVFLVPVPSDLLGEAIALGKRHDPGLAARLEQARRQTDDATMALAAGR